MSFIKAIGLGSLALGVILAIWTISRKRTKTRKSSYKESFKQKSELIAVIVGTTESGKTTVFNSIVSTTPRVLQTYYGYTTANLLVQGHKLKIYDVEEERTDYLRFLNAKDIDLIIYVLDSTATNKLNQCSKDIRNILNDRKFKNAKVIVVASKQDAWRALYIKQIPYLLKIPSNRRLSYTTTLNVKDIIEIIKNVKLT